MKSKRERREIILSIVKIKGVKANWNGGPELEQSSDNGSGERRVVDRGKVDVLERGASRGSEGGMVYVQGNVHCILDSFFESCGSGGAGS